GDLLTVGLRSAYSFHMENLNRPENREIVEGALARVLARPLRFRCQLYDTPPAAPLADVTEAAPAADAGPAAATAETAAVQTAATAPEPGDAMSFVERARQMFGAEIVDERPAP
ncbi:MAG: hypothetical protein QN120_04345, partial [Armatimonadota bacterium]|nr:hypothetical protein [Armatimonadota bacterium]